MPVTINGDGSITGLSVGGLGSGVVNTATIASGAITSALMPSGSILQVKQVGNNDQITQTTSTDFDIVTVSLTPTAVGNKIFVFGTVMGIQNGGGSNNTRLLCRVRRDSTNLMNSEANHWLQGTTTVLRHGGFSINVVDTAPSTNATTYKLVGYWSDTGGSQCFVNKDFNSGSSTITVMEVKA